MKKENSNKILKPKQQRTIHSHCNLRNNPDQKMQLKDKQKKPKLKNTNSYHKITKKGRTLHRGR